MFENPLRMILRGFFYEIYVKIFFYYNKAFYICTIINNKTNKMKTLDRITLTGLTIVVTVIVPLITMLIIKLSTNPVTHF